MIILTQEQLDQLISISGADNVLIHKDSLDKYSKDETENISYLPHAVITPESTEMISEIMRFANREKIKVIPRGGGTGLSGGAIPAFGGIVLSLEKMNRILEIDKENFFARVETGIITEEFQNRMEELDLFYPPDPASRGTCMIGGNIAENSGGPRAAKYGVTMNYLLGIKGVMPDGSIFSWGGPVIKNVSGYDLRGLFCGSEGTLCIITEATLRLIKKPEFRKMILAPFTSAEEGIRTVAEIYKKGGNPSVLEFMEKDAIEASEKHLDEKWPVNNFPAFLLIEIDGNKEGSVESELELIIEILEEAGCDEAILAEDSTKMNNLWRLRRSIGEAVKAISEYKEEDAVVPRAKLPQLYNAVRELEKKYGIKAISYGHAGDGNIHINILKNDLSDEEWEKTSPLYIKELFTSVMRLNGAITGEHGVGLTQKEYLKIGLSSETIDIMKKIKTALDPDNILNPGKIFDL